ncbi:MAG: hypothetical protein FWF96_03665, partial [Kiritimatiellaeota bacterium]|nr:hypothetical protein [Kiritimatiellota bacterium]
AAAQDAPLTATPVQYTLVMPEAECVRESGIWIPHDKTGCEINYAIKGNGLVDVDQESLAITSITSRDGRDLSKDKNGQPTWRLVTHATQLSRNRDYANIKVFVATDEPLEIPVVKGSVTCFCADNPLTETVDFATDEKEVEKQLGPLAFSIPDDKDKSTLGGAIRFTFNNQTVMKVGDAFFILMKGDRTLVTQIKIISGDQEFNSVGSMFTDNQTTYYRFAAKPETPEFTLSVTYYTDMREVVCAIGEQAPETNDW